MASVQIGEYGTIIVRYRKIGVGTKVDSAEGPKFN